MARHRHNLTQKRLAEETGVGIQTILRAEHNKSINAESRRLLCNYFSMTAEDLGLSQDVGTKAQAAQPALDGASVQTAPLSHAIAQEILLATRELDYAPMDKSRRHFLVGLTSSKLIPSPRQELLYPPLWERLSKALTHSSNIDEDTLRQFEAITKECWQSLPTVTGVLSCGLLNYASARLEVITDLLTTVHTSASRARLAAIAAQLAQIVGEILFDREDNTQAERYYNVAIEAARQAQDPILQAVGLGRKSFIAIYGKNAQQALPWLEEAHTLLQHQAPDTTRAWLSAVEAEAQALAGNSLVSLRALDRSEYFIDRATPGEASYARFSKSTLFGYRGICHVHLKQSTAAQQILHTALRSMASSRLRHRAIVLVDLAITYMQQGEIEEACKVATQALTIIRDMPSLRVFQRVLRLRRQLEPWRHTPMLRDLDEHIIEKQQSLLHY